MIDIPQEMEGIPVAIEFLGANESFLEELRNIFNGPEEQVVFSHAFGGQDALIVVAAFGKQTLEKLISFWPKMRSSTPKTNLKINKSSVTIQGFTLAEVEALLASPNFAKAVRSVRKK